MGAQSSNDGFPNYDIDAEANESPTHKVTLSTYEIMETEVTVAMFTECVESGACNIVNFKTKDIHEGCSYGNPDIPVDHPMNCVTWYGAKEFCQWIGGDLPTEAQWEFAARGLASRKYPWGNSPAPSCDLAVMFDATVGCGDGTTWAVESKPNGATPDPPGPVLYDLAGNVWEWTNDWYEDYTEDAVINPKGPCEGDTDCPGYSKRVMKGGSYLRHAEHMRAAYRQTNSPIFWDVDLGFRCVF
jgi:formylglycine-generating enzyme